CESRLKKMLAHEFELLTERLGPTRGKETKFFAFADTVATHSSEETQSRSHGWLGVRFQTQPGGPANDIILHVKMWDRLRLQQQDALGILGVNLIHLAFFPEKNTDQILAQLMDQLSALSLEINMIRFEGPQVAHIDNRLMALELVKQGITEAVLFGPDGDVVHINDELFRTPVLVHRGTFRPITKANQEIIERSLSHFASLPENKGLQPEVLLEITMNALYQEGKVNTEDFLQRVDTLSLLQHHVLISNHEAFYQLKAYLRRSTDKLIGMVIGGALLEKIFDESTYKNLSGGILEGFSRLFDEKSRIFVYPYKTDQVCINSQSFFPQPDLKLLLDYLKNRKSIVDLLNCDDVDTTILSKDVRQMLAQKVPQWEEHVPDVVAKAIKFNRFFGY
ncbi:MAG TPA: hypothetical protein DCL41_02610, partial [Bdellovibrionales bacterium]|nr:hypothetical protein [Bdellovibrionales bacterium]